MKNTQPIDLPIGAGYLCHDCGHTDGDIMADSTWDFKKCAKCGKKSMLHIEFGRSDLILFVFTWSHGTETYKMNEKMETRKISIYTVDGYDDFDENMYNDIKLDKQTPVKGTVCWSMTFGMQLTRLDGVKVSGFPFGFDSQKLLESIKFTMLPDYIQLRRRINLFVQRYHMGFVELKGQLGRKSTWQMQKI
jgi:hypothetical protein